MLSVSLVPGETGQATYRSDPEKMVIQPKLEVGKFMSRPESKHGEDNGQASFEPHDRDDHWS